MVSRLRPLLFLSALFVSSFAHALCVQTFNAYGAFYASATAARTDAIARELRKTNCDVIQLQETFNASAADMPTVFEKALASTHALYAATREVYNGLVTFARGELVEKKFHQFYDQTLMGIRKGFTVTRARFAGVAEDVALVNVHLHHSSQPSRMAQMTELIAWRLEHPELTMILTGDFNSDPGSAERRLVTALLRLRDPVEEARGGYTSAWCTYCKENPRSWDGFPFGSGADHVYDYIYVSAGTSATLDFAFKSVDVNLKGVTGFTLSDHYGVTAELEARDFVASTEDVVKARVANAITTLLSVDAELVKLRADQAERARAFLKRIRSQLDKQTGSAYAYLSR